MNGFNEVLKEWQIFYATVAAASATLTGLLFVALSINVERFKKKEAENQMRIARRAFGDFLYVLMISLVFLVPNQIPLGFAIALLVLALSRGIGLIRLVLEATRHKKMKNSSVHPLREFALPLLACIGLIAIAFAVLVGQFDLLYYLVGVIATLLASACWNAWTLLLQN
jgi:hypothetical protein